MMILMLLTMLAGSPGSPASTEVARHINAFCHGEQSCIGEQRESLRHFDNLSVRYNAPKSQTKRCMTAGKVAARRIDWRIAESCMRAWSKGRKADS